MMRYISFIQRLFVIITALACLGGCVPDALGGTAHAMEKVTRITTWTDGNAVRDIEFVSDHEIWTATSGGIVRWNPLDRSFTHFTTQTGLPDNWFHCMTRSPGGTLWFGSRFGGLVSFDGGAWSVLTTSSGMPENEVTALAADASGRIYAGFGAAFGNGLGVWDGSTWTLLTTADGLLGNRINALFFEPEIGVWVGTGGGLNLIENGMVTASYTTADGLSHNLVHSITADTQHNLWIGTDAGLTLKHSNLWTSFAGEGLPDDHIRAVVVDSDNVVWVGTDAGIAYRRNGAWHALTPEQNLSGWRATALAAASDGSMFCGTDDGGMQHLVEGAAADIYTVPGWLKGNEVRSVAYRDNRLWYCTASGTIGWFDGSQSAVWRLGDPLAPPLIRGFDWDDSGVLWAGTYGQGVFRFENGTWTSFGIEEGLPSLKILDVIRDADGSIWFLTFGDGAANWNGVDWRYIDTSNGLPSNIVYRVETDCFDHVWFCTDAGVTRWDGVSWHSWFESDGLVFHRVYDLEQDQDGVMWFGACKGMSRFDGRSFRNYYVEDGLPHYRVRRILSRPHGAAWLATGAGISFFDGVAFYNQSPLNGLSGWETLSLIAAGPSTLYSCAEGGISRIDLESTTDCSQLEVALSMPATLLESGIVCSCTARICNPLETDLVQYPLCVLLELNGAYYFAPEFSLSFDSYLDQLPAIPPGTTSIPVIAPLLWPDGIDPFNGAVWLAAILSPDLSSLVTDIALLEFGWN